MRIWLCVALAALVLSPARAQENLPAEIAAAFKEAGKECEGRITTRQGFVSRRDVNADGASDYILNYEHARCEEFETMFCGTGGCLVQVFASLGDDTFAKVMDAPAFSVKFARRKGLPAMIQRLHGGRCGRSGGDGPCESVTYWNGETFGPAYPVGRR